ncbi:hypothetical protein P40081_19580 [Paenibacillus sp. FSL P4-0081]|nr:hypothetical protein P40081_19580 [Paenibacillus sp. FSL P4-0081]
MHFQDEWINKVEAVGPRLPLQRIRGSFSNGCYKEIPKCIPDARREVGVLHTTYERTKKSPWCDCLLFTQKVNQKGKAARFMETGAGMSFASKRQGRNIP